MTKLVPKMVATYDWFKDIQPLLCKHLGIDEKYFRDYHEVYKGPFVPTKFHKTPYYDFWHVWLSCFGETLRNDSYVVTYFGVPGEDRSYLEGKLLEEYGPWSIDLLNAVDKMVTEQGWEDQAIVIWYSW